MPTSQPMIRSMCILLASSCISGGSAKPFRTRSDDSGSLTARHNNGPQSYEITNDTAAFITDNSAGWWGVQAYVDTGVYCDRDVPPSFTASWDQAQPCMNFGFDESSSNVEAVAAFLPTGWELTLSDRVCGETDDYGVVSTAAQARSGNWYCYEINNSPFLSFSVQQGNGASR